MERVIAAARDLRVAALVLERFPTVDERTLRLFACDCAERELMRKRAAGEEPDARSWAGIEVARRKARGQATYAEMAAVRVPIVCPGGPIVSFVLHPSAAAAARLAAQQAVWSVGCDAATTASLAVGPCDWAKVGYAAMQEPIDAERRWQLAHLREMLRKEGK